MKEADMLKRRIVIALFALTAIAVLTPSSTQAWSSKVNHLTFNTAVRLPGNTLLTPGSYTFEAGPQGNSMDIVRVTTRDGRRVLYTGFTTLTTRPARGPMVSFAEAPAGAPQPISVWYEDGAKIGHQFRY
jgi:hypothetical protein